MKRISPELEEIRHLSKKWYRSLPGYGPRRLPCPLDDEISLFVKAYEAGSLEDRKFLEACIDPNNQKALVIFAEHMASLAVRTKKPQRIIEGLIGLGVAHKHSFHRMDTLSACLLYHAAMRLLGTAREIFEDTLRRVGDEEFASYLRRYLNLSEDMKRLEAWDQEEGKDEDGFRYTYIRKQRSGKP